MCLLGGAYRTLARILRRTLDYFDICENAVGEYLILHLVLTPINVIIVR